MSSNNPLFIFRLCPVVLELIGLSKEEGKALLTRCGLPESAAVGACTAPLSRIRQFLEEAGRRCEAPLGLALAQAAPEGTYETAELLVRTAPSLRLGLEALARYAPLINPVGTFELRSRDASMEIHYYVHGSKDALGAHLNEFTLAYVIQSLRRTSAGPFQVESVWFAHREPSHPAALEAVFGCPALMAASTCGFSLKKNLLEQPLRTADRIVFRYLEGQASTRLKALGKRSFTAVVVDMIENRVGFSATDLESIARSLGATGRTVQRRLEEEGGSFREVFDGARRRRAEAMLAHGYSANQIADSLGFADVRSYRRALRRWSDDSAMDTEEDS